MAERAPDVSVAPSGFKRRSVMLGGGALAVLALAGGAAVSFRRLALDPQDVEALAVFHQHNWEDARGQGFDARALKGQPMVLNFWATWCPPCVEEMPELGALQREFASAGLRVVGLGVDTAARIAAFETKMTLGYPLLVAGGAGAELGRRLGNASGALPFTIVVDRQGRIRDRILGRFSLPRLEARVREAVA